LYNDTSKEILSGGCLITDDYGENLYNRQRWNGEKMKIVLINASSRKNGATSKILNEFSNNLSSKSNVEVNLINVSDLKLEFCLGCCQCYKTGICFIKDDAEIISKLLAGADGIIIGTPCYASSISGQLKTLIDRGHFVIEQLLMDKHAVGVVTYENADGGSAFKALKKLFIYSGSKTVGKLLVKLPFNSDPIADEATKASIKKQSDKLYNSIVNKKKSVTNTIIHFFVFNFGIKPFVLKKGDLYSGVLDHWKNRNIDIKQ